MNTVRVKDKTALEELVDVPQELTTVGVGWSEEHGDSRHCDIVAWMFSLRDEG
jgi:hypothetical protein